LCDICERLHPETAPADAAEVSEESIETVSEAAVEIAQIEAERDVKIAQLDIKREEVWQEGRVTELEGEIRGMRELLDRLAPEPEPEPEPVVIVAEPEPEPEPEPVIDALPAAEPKAAKKKSGWSWY
jgi:hypothetical protein